VRVSFEVNPDTAARLEALATIYAKKVNAIAREALADWCETIGQARIDVFTGCAATNVVTTEADDACLLDLAPAKVRLAN